MLKITESERMLSALMNNLPGMAYQLIKKKNWEVEFISNGSRLVTGYEPSFFIGKYLKGFKVLILPEDLNKVSSQMFKQTTKLKSQFQSEYRIVTSSGNIKWVFDKAERFFSDDGKLVSIKGFITDFTVFKQMEQTLRKENWYLRSTIKDRYKFDNIIGSSQAMQEVYELILKAAKTNDPVFISGASGTGKELVARALHNASDRSSGNFVAINCGAIPENLIENEFFGSRDSIEKNEVVVVNWEKIRAKDKETGEWTNTLMRDSERYNFREVLANTKQSGKLIFMIIDESHQNAQTDKDNQACQ